MILRLRLLVLLARPSLVVLLGLFTATGLAQGGAGNDAGRLMQALAAVVAYLVVAVVLNDLADETIDRVNLPRDRTRPLVAGAGTRRELLVVAGTAAAAALGVAATIGWPALAVVAAGLALSAGYSLRPVRVADRGALASLLLPSGYVAVPYLVGMFTAPSGLGGDDLVLLGGLYVGFIGRILLKDFRDVRGDTLFGKRTFLVRHGRGRTCGFSAACWILGSVGLAGVDSVTPELAGAFALFVGVAMVLLRRLAQVRGARRDEALISALAVVGRATTATLIAHLSMTDAGWTPTAYRGAMVLLVVVMVGQAATMARQGPFSRLRLRERAGVLLRPQPAPGRGPVAAGS
ncbi:MAG: UbiA family prenyltransferase [Actinobacteria bacterium]|nr:UbiA family prenyltransferase [Actinomycetota bacterium]